MLCRDIELSTHQFSPGPNAAPGESRSALLVPSNTGHLAIRRARLWPHMHEFPQLGTWMARKNSWTQSTLPCGWSRVAQRCGVFWLDDSIMIQ